MYRFTKIGESVAASYYPEIITSTDTEDAADILRAFKGFLVSCTFHPDTVDAAILELAEELQEDE